MYLGDQLHSYLVLYLGQEQFTIYSGQRGLGITWQLFPSHADHVKVDVEVDQWCFQSSYQVFFYCGVH